MTEQDVEQFEHSSGLSPALEATKRAICALAKQALRTPQVDPERLTQMIAHRACCGVEADSLNGKIHGYCLVCGVPWPCEYVGPLPSPPAQEEPKK